MAKRKASRKRRGASPPAELQRTFPAAPHEADQVLEDVMQMLKKNQCPCGDLDEVRTALREALNNALRHGCELDPQKNVRLLARCDSEKGLEVVLHDEGKGFDPDAVPDPTTPENLDRFSGRGIYMIRKLMDEVEFRDEGRQITMRRRRD